MRTIVSQSVSARETDIKKISLGKNCFLYISDRESMIFFETGSFNFDLLKQVIDLYKGVRRANQARSGKTRSGIIAKTPSALKDVLDRMLKNLPSTFTAMDKVNLTSEFREDLASYLGVLQAGINALQDLESKSS